jgi:hypothetical protein
MDCEPDNTSPLLLSYDDGSLPYAQANVVQAAASGFTRL